MFELYIYGAQSFWHLTQAIASVSTPPYSQLIHSIRSTPSFASSISLSPMEGDDQKELQLLPAPRFITSSSSQRTSRPSDSSIRFRSKAAAVQADALMEGPNSLDLQLSISVRPIRQPASSSDHCVNVAKPSICEFDGGLMKGTKGSTGCVEALKWQAAEQIRLAAMEKAYAERVRELTRREMELAQSEFTRARHMWERAREEVEKAERMKEKAMLQMDSTCMEITCQSCRQRFRP